jgi:hypothetical protein
MINRPAAAMTNQELARIQWLSPVEGGRKAIPVGPNYTTVARFKGQGPDWINDAWSLVIEFVSPINGDLTMLAKVKFLAEDAPSGWLNEGAEFELLEGCKVVARGVTIRP